MSERMALGQPSPPPSRAASSDSILEVEGLSVNYLAGAQRPLPALRDVSFSLRQGSVLGIVGETGSGKTTLAHTLMGLLSGASIAGSVEFMGRPLPVEDDAAMRPIRWRRIALVFQSANSGFDPVHRVGEQIGEPLVAKGDLPIQECHARALAAWEDVGLPIDRFDHYPHQLSGGEKRLAMLAMALVCSPELLLLDEPTAGLDAFTRVEILRLLGRLKRSRGLSMMVITHTLTDLQGLADRTMVIYGGRVVEMGDTGDLLSSPRHPYSWGLLNSYPTMGRAKDLWGIRGDPFDSAAANGGCQFAPRCTQAIPRCFEQLPELKEVNGRSIACHLGGLQLLLEARGLSKSFRGHRGQPVQAVRDASLRLMEGELLAIVGQTGSGKSTLARLIVGMIGPDAGDVWLQGRSIMGLSGQSLRESRRCLQLVFQDPLDALSPRLSVIELVREPLDIVGDRGREDRLSLAREALSEVHLPTSPAFLAKRTHELSGGQLQRVAIARALVTRPKVMIADEPVSMLDASEQARLVRLLKDIQNERGMGLLLISHDIALVRKVADRILVMEAGAVVEEGPAERVIASPQHPYTRRLLAAAYGTVHREGIQGVEFDGRLTHEEKGGTADGLEPGSLSEELSESGGRGLGGLPSGGL